jgi:glycosyltransferase involved in cell wall biosynthesis
LSLSVAMCTYNGSKYLKEQLDSIAAQTRLPDELVICDDYSQDNTIDVINDFASIAPFRIQIIKNETNIGYIKNFEKAINLCKSDIIALSDQDDIWLPEKLARIEQVFAADHDVKAVFSNAVVVDEHLKPLGYTEWDSIRFNKKEQLLMKKGQSIDVLLRHNVVSGAMLAFRTSYKDIILPIPDGCMHDAWIATIIALYSGLAMIDEPLIQYRQHAEQQIGAKRNGNNLRHFSGEALGLLKNKSLFLNKRRQESLRYLNNELLLYESIKKRVLNSNTIRPPQIMKKIDEKIGHLEVRSKINKKKRANRILPIFKEVTAARYRHYSNGVAYIVKDLLL